MQVLVAEMESRVEKRYNSVYAEITAITQNYLAEIQNRGQALLARLDNIHKVKMTTLAQQKRDLASTTICLAQVCGINSHTVNDRIPNKFGFRSIELRSVSRRSEIGQLFDFLMANYPSKGGWKFYSYL